MMIYAGKREKGYIVTTEKYLHIMNKTAFNNITVGQGFSLA